MLKSIVFLASICSLFVAASVFQETQLTGEESVQDILEQLGAPASLNRPDELVYGATAEIGEKLVKTGFTDKGVKKRQSKHFVCTSCHNIEQESAYLNLVDPQERLEYTTEKGLPFLPGSPLFGIVNRNRFYNDDYFKKYGDLVYSARTNIREAIQLCATECSQGRALKDWEIESILKYLWTIDLKLKNLVIDGNELDLLEQALQDDSKHESARKLLESKFMDHEPSHLAPPPYNYKLGFDSIKGNPSNGKLIYENACLHCHKNNDYSFYELDNERPSFKQLARRMKRYNQGSFYHAIRYGTSPVYGKKAYMPYYTREKMSDQQLEDLRSYILNMAD